MNSFFDSQLNYCPLVWMLHIRNANTKINNQHFGAFKIIHRDERVLILFIIYVYINFLRNLFHAKLFFNHFFIIFIYDLDILYK